MLDFYLRCFSPAPEKWGPSLANELTKWVLSDAEQCVLLGIDTSQLSQLMMGRPREIAHEINLRALLAMAIVQLLHDMSDEPGFARRWLNRKIEPSPFKGRTPRALMCSSSRDDLDALYTTLIQIGFG